jgi:hypothetical protein
MFKEFGQLAGLVKQAQALSSRLPELQRQLADRCCTGKAGGGHVEIDLNGQGNVLAVRIDPEFFRTAARGQVEQCVAEALTDAQIQVQSAAADILGPLAQGAGDGRWQELFTQFGLARP